MVQDVPPTNLIMTADLTVGTNDILIPVSAATTRAFRLKGHDDNAGILYIGLTGVKNDGTLDYVNLRGGDEHEFKYNNIDNPLFVIASEANQVLNYGIIL